MTETRQTKEERNHPLSTSECTTTAGHSLRTQNIQRTHPRLNPTGSTWTKRTIRGWVRSWCLAPQQIRIWAATTDCSGIRSTRSMVGVERRSVGRTDACPSRRDASSAGPGSAASARRPPGQTEHAARPEQWEAKAVGRRSISARGENPGN